MARPAAARSHRAHQSRSRPPVVNLVDATALDLALTGTKAAALARAALGGLPVLPGFVLTTAARAGPATPELGEAWWRLTDDGGRPVVVRSSAVEDGWPGRTAGRVTSVLAVHGWRPFLDAVAAVLGSSKAVPGRGRVPIAVLVQPQLAIRVGGVLFGADPVSGRADHLVTALGVSGSPGPTHYLLSRRGRRLEADRLVPAMGRRELRVLARLAARAAAVFGEPQRLEWAFDESGRVHLLQSGPIATSTVETGERGSVLDSARGERATAAVAS